MDNVSFKANLKISPDFYKSVSKGMPDGYAETLAADFKKFIDHPKIKAATEGDTVELSAVKQQGGHGIEMKFISDKLPEAFKTEIHTGKTSKVDLGRLKYWTYMFLCHKQGEKPRAFETGFKMIERVLFNNQKIFPR